MIILTGGDSAEVSGYKDFKCSASDLSKEEKKCKDFFNALENVNEAQCILTCHVPPDAHRKWCENMKHLFAMTRPQIRLSSSTLVEDLGRKLHVPHLQSQRLRMNREQMAAGRGLSETARPADVKVYLIPLTLYQTTHSFLFLALKENGGYSGNPGISLGELHFP